MSSPFVGEIRMFAGTFAPSGWLFCNGTPMPISENEVLFQLIGTTYGGDGQSTFNLPDLQCRFPIHQGTGPDGSTYVIGEQAGTEQETLTVQQIPSHTHPLLATNDPGQQSSVTGLVPARATVDAYNTDTQGIPVAMAPQSLTPAGGSQPHENMQPFLCLNFIISLFGEFPQAS
jgi:microcystin-dependent protein